MDEFLYGIGLKPTPLFPRPAEGQPLRQLARLRLTNPGASFPARARITFGAAQPYEENLGQLRAGASISVLYPNSRGQSSALVLVLKDARAAQSSPPNIFRRLPA